MQYIQNNVSEKSFKLKDPGNSNNDVVETLETWERQNLSQRMETIIKRIESDEEQIKLYFPISSQSSEGYGIKKTSTISSVPPNNQRFGK